MSGRRLGIVVSVYLLHLALALALAWPVARLLADGATAHPRGDQVLFEPGATYLVEAFRLQRASLTDVAEGSVLAILVASYLGLLPLAALMHALAHTGKVTFPSLAGAAGRFFAPFSLLLGLALLATALFGFVPLAIGGLLDEKIKNLLNDRDYDIAHAAFRVIALIVACLVAVVHDLARAATVSREIPALPAAILAARVFRASPWRAVGEWGIRCGTGIFLVVGAAYLTYRSGISTGWRFAFVTVLHQGIAFSLVLLRSRWLAAALRLVDESQPTMAR
jgi:hypothetical protein